MLLLHCHYSWRIFHAQQRLTLLQRKLAVSIGCAASVHCSSAAHCPIGRPHYHPPQGCKTVIIGNRAVSALLARDARPGFVRHVVSGCRSNDALRQMCFHHICGRVCHLQLFGFVPNSHGYNGAHFLLCATVFRCDKVHGQRCDWLHSLDHQRSATSVRCCAMLWLRLAFLLQTQRE